MIIQESKTKLLRRQGLDPNIHGANARQGRGPAANDDWREDARAGTEMIAMAVCVFVVVLLLLVGILHFVAVVGDSLQ